MKNANNRLLLRNTLFANINLYARVFRAKSFEGYCISVVREKTIKFKIGEIASYSTFSNVPSWISRSRKLENVDGCSCLIINTTSTYAGR